MKQEERKERYRRRGKRDTGGEERKTLLKNLLSSGQNYVSCAKFAGVVIQTFVVKTWKLYGSTVMKYPGLTLN